MSSALNPTVSNQPQLLHNPWCLIKHTEEKGRGVYASKPIPRQTVIDISPVLIFAKDEYHEHGRFTTLDHYTFKWSDGRMALALGLGSLFNHSERPNLSYLLDASTDAIQYVTTRAIEVDEELSIFYGHKLWFKDADDYANPAVADPEEAEDGWGGLSAVVEVTDLTEPDGPFLDGDPSEIMADEDLPFTRFRLPPDEEEIDTIRTTQAWVVDIPDPRLITEMLKWLKQAGLDTPDLGHLKRIRKQNDMTTLLLTTSPVPPILPGDLDLPMPYTLLVPISPALTPISLKLKSSFWPTIFTPSRKGEAEAWSRGKSRWAWDAMIKVVEAANEARNRGELPIAAHIAAPYNEDSESDSAPTAFIACDSRNSNAHPLRHAVINVIRQMADHRTTADPSTPEESISLTPSEAGESRNGTNYLLTSRTVFTTHEPCIMCSMALIHSRVKEVFYLYPMPRTGGCGGIACLPTLKGVNHRFGICQWNIQGAIVDRCNLQLDAAIDA
ncbi:SET domain-containing protein 7 [Hypsizygus marmoreus]|uniref:SET domain-containing protein 7 n=1 Tax=Hypsizygus marmoreus TaxID=39966 RepID=A0A369J9K4_HYPMA|nr:SET domain-containing protein 7 [Hypsizygus marmoreus]